MELSAEDIQAVAATGQRIPRVPQPLYTVTVVDGHGNSAVARGSSADYIDPICSSADSTTDGR